MLRTPTHRSFAVAALLAATLAISCGPDITGPHGGVRYARGITFQPVFPALASQAADAGLVPFSTVHIVLHHADGSIALDTIVNFPADATELTLSLNVPLAASAPAGGEPLSLNLAYVNAAGVTVFEGGPFPIVAVPSVAGSPPPPPVNVPVTYTGPGSTATSVVITPHSQSVLSGDAFGFTATAFDASGAPLPGTPIVFSSSNTALAPISSPGSGSGTAAVGRGTSTITAQLLTGPSDAATLTIQPRPSAVALVSGSGQTAQVGAAVPLSAIVRVTATDGLGVSGVSVSFAALNGGSAAPATILTGTDGTAQTTWTLGNVAGAQSLTASVAGVSGSPVTFSATATPKPPTKLAFSGQPSSAPVGASIGTVTVAVQDASNNLSTTFTGPVSIALATNPGGATLTGATTVNAVAGVATFTGLSLNKTGLGYTLSASSTGLTGATSSAFDIAAGLATRVEFTTQPGSAVAGAVMSPVRVTARDVAGNVANTYTGPISLSISSNPGGSSLGGSSTVNAVAGVATFSNLSLNKSGQNYTLLASGTGLGAEVSSGFNITAGPPALCVVASGNNQTSPAGTTINIGIQVTDALGNGIPGAGVNGAVASGGGAVAPASATADPFGLATFAWTLGPTLGSQSLSATCTGVATGVSVTATAISGTAGPATQLSFTAQPNTVTAGIPNSPSIVVAAKDAVGLTATTFTGNVTLSISTNPGGSTLGGTLTVAAVAGVATFSNVRLNKIGVGYTLHAVAGTLAPTNSTAFTVTSAPAFLIQADSGDGQSAPASTLLPVKLVALVTDSLANPVAGTNVTFAIATGGGSLSPNGTVATDANGRVRTNWTLGPTGGAQSVTATSVGLAGSPRTYNATATGAPISLVWTGAVDSSWTNPANWSPAQLPTAVDSVTIPSGGLNAVITTPVTVHHLVMTGCNSMTNNSTLTITGHYVDNSNSCLRALPTGRAGRLAKYVQGSGTIVLSGTGNLMGSLNGVAINITGGTHTVLSSTNLNGTVTVSGAAVLNVNGKFLSVSGDFATTGTGVIQMQDPVGVFNINGNANFAGGAETGLLTDGAIHLSGNFIATGARFDATGTHTLFMDGCVTPQNLDFTLPLAGHGIHHLHFDCTNAKTITGTPTVTGDLTIDGAGVVAGLGVSVTVMGNLTDATGALGGGWQVPNTFLNSNGQISGQLFNTNFVIVGGTVKLENDALMSLNGSITVSGATSVLDINGASLLMAGNFQTNGGGRLKMVEPTDLDFMLIAGNANFAGGSTAGLLTHGLLIVEGNFDQGGGANDAFAPAATHTTELGTASGFDGPFLRAPARSRAPGLHRTAAPARLPSQVRVDAPALRVPSGLTGKAADVERRAHERVAHARQNARQTAQPAARLGARAPFVKVPNAHATARDAILARVKARLERSAAAPRIKSAMAKALTARLLQPASVNFTTPGTGAGTSHFGNVEIITEELDLLSNVFVEGVFAVDDDDDHLIAGSNNAITVRGADMFLVEFENVRFVLLDGADVSNIGDVVFDDMDPTVNQLTIQRTGTGPTGDLPQLFSIEFDSPPTTGNYISATDTDGPAPDALFIDMQFPLPATHGGHIQMLNGATTDWSSSFVWTGLGTTDLWNDAGNWSAGFAPDILDDITIPAGTPHDPRLNADAFSHNITLAAGVQIDLGCSSYSLFIYGNLSAPTGANSIPTCEGEGITLIGDGGNNTITGSFGVVDIFGVYQVVGQLIVSDYLGVLSGVLDVNGGRVDVGGVGGTGDGFFYTEANGQLAMNNAADQMFVGNGGAYFQGGSTAGFLSAGTLTIVNGCVHTFAGIGDPAAFAASGTHLTVFTGSEGNVEFGDPTQSFLKNVDIPDISQLLVLSDFSVKGTLTHSGTGAAAISAVTPFTMTVSGVNNTQPLLMSGVAMKLVDGAASTTFDNVVWSGFPAAFTGNVFDVNRSGAGTLTFNNHVFTGLSLGTGGHWLVNRGTMNVHMATPTPGTVTTEVQQIGTGTIVWP